MATAASPAAAQTYTQPFSVDEPIRRSSRSISVTVSDGSCSADETHDSPERFAGVEVRKTRHAWVLTASFREQDPPPTGASDCGAVLPNEDVVRTTVRLPAPVGDRAIVDGAPGPGGFRFVQLPPVGRGAIRSLVPAYIYSGDDCDTGPVRAAFRGTRKTEWCFY